MTHDSQSRSGPTPNPGESLSVANQSPLAGEPVEVQPQRVVYEGAGEGDERELVLVRGDGRAVIRYRMGEEAGVFKQIEELAEDQTTIVDWYDAALMAHEMGKRLREVLHHRRAKAG
jgi:hypothetical protein